MANTIIVTGDPVSSSLIQWVKRRLGHPKWPVNLTDDQLQDALDDALRLFNQYMMVITSTVVTSPPQTESSTMQVQLDDDVFGVFEVTFVMPETSRIYAQMSIFEIIHRWFYPGLRLGEWYMLRSFYEMYQRVRGTEPDWRYHEAEHMLYLDVWSGPYDVCYTTASGCTATTLLTGTKKRYERKFRDVCLGYAEITMSQVIGKWGGIPGPAGTLTPNADTMISAGQRKIDDVEAYLKGLAQAHYYPQIG